MPTESKTAEAEVMEGSETMAGEGAVASEAAATTSRIVEGDTEDMSAAPEAQVLSACIGLGCECRPSMHVYLHRRPGHG